MLTEADLNSMRTVAEQALPGTAIVQTVAGSVDAYGDRTDTWTAAGTVACRVAPLNGTEREIGDRISSDADSIITLPWDASVTTNSRLVVSGRGTFNVEHIRVRDYPATTRVEAVKQV